MKPVGTQLKRLLKTSSFTLTFVLFPFVGLALEVKDVPNPRQINGTWVTDMARILDQPTEAQLNSVISQLERQNGTEIAVVTVPETAPSGSPKEFTTALFKYWGIGKKGQDNGVLFLISKGDRRVEIETGYGIEAILPDAKVSNIINTQITPRFKQGDFNGGTLAGTKALVVALDAPQPSSVSNKPTAMASSAPTATLAAAQPFALSPEPTQDANAPWGLLIGGGLVLAIGTAGYVKRHRVLSERVFIEPEGRTRLEKDASNSNRFFHCTNCKKQLEKLEQTKLQSHLSKPEQVAQRLGSVKFEGWQCRRCQEQLPGAGVHIFAYVLNKERFSKCSTCKELTVTRTLKAVLEEPTWNREGRQLVSQKCHCCSYSEDVEEKIPCLSPPPNTVFIKPTGRSRVTGVTRLWQPIHCADCRYPMQQLNSTALESHLNKPEQVAQRIGSRKFIGWQCPNCSQQPGSHLIHIRAYVLPANFFRECRNCKELTVMRTRKILKFPTENRDGKELIIDQCHCCDYHQQKEETIPRLSPPPPPSPSSSRGGFYSGSDYSGGGFSGGCDGGGSFGGGDSGGGGAGGGW
ncbi:MAG TPA: TPM domain-containing protein [Coleofasciculaceae cyanobacterium]